MKKKDKIDKLKISLICFFFIIGFIWLKIFDRTDLENYDLLMNTGHIMLSLILMILILYDVIKDTIISIKNKKFAKVKKRFIGASYFYYFWFFGFAFWMLLWIMPEKGQPWYFYLVNIALFLLGAALLLMSIYCLYYKLRPKKKKK